ncbi:ROK family protein [Caldiplasma sukawensis]
MGFDIGGSKISMFLTDSTGKIYKRSRIKTPKMKNPEQLVNLVAEIAEDVEKDIKEDIETVSVVIAGAVDGKRGIIHSSPNLFGGEKINFSEMLEKRLSKNVFIENDATAVAISEKIFGNGKTFNNFVYVTLSTGIGGGIIQDGRVYRGSRGMAGEFGHMVIKKDGPLCGCGRKGCLESLASGLAAVRIMNENGAYEKSPYLRRFKKDKVEAKTIFEGALSGDQECNKIVNEIMGYIVTGISNLIDIFDPESVMIGGGMSDSRSLVFEPLSKAVFEELKTMSREVKFFKTSQITVELAPLAVVMYENEIPGFNYNRIIKEMREKLRV